MPFTKISKGQYKSPSGKTLNAAQVALYYATKGFKQQPKRA